MLSFRTNAAQSLFVVINGKKLMIYTEFSDSITKIHYFIKRY